MITLFEALNESKSRGDCVFPAEHKNVNDNKDHFPINSINQARNALAQMAKYDSAPDWYDGTLESLKNAISRAVHKKYPSIGK